MIIDSHCHLFYEEIANDIDSVIQRANEAGVSRFICVGTNVEDSKNVYQLLKITMIFSCFRSSPARLKRCSRWVFR